MSVRSRRKDEPKGTNGNSARVKLRWVELDAEGESAALVDAFAAALTCVTGVTVPTRVLAAPKSAATTSTAVIDDPGAEEDLEDSAEPEATEEIPSEIIGGSGADRPKRRPAPRAPKFLNDVDLTKAAIQLADFIHEKNPDGDMDKYAVIAVWFKQNLDTEEITIDHIFTAYKALGWQAQLPVDPSQTLRNLKSNKNWFDSGSKRGAYKINWNGESAVNRMGAAKP